MLIDDDDDDSPLNNNSVANSNQPSKFKTSQNNRDTSKKLQANPTSPTLPPIPIGASSPFCSPQQNKGFKGFRNNK